MKTICQLHYSLYMTLFNDIRGYPLFISGRYKYGGVEKSYHPLTEDYKTPPLLMRVVTRSILWVYSRLQDPF